MSNLISSELCISLSEIYCFDSHVSSPSARHTFNSPLSLSLVLQLTLELTDSYQKSSQDMSNSLALSRAAFRALIEKGGFDRILEKVSLSDPHDEHDYSTTISSLVSITLQVNLTFAEAGRATAEVEIGKELASRYGYAHGGAIATLVDSISTIALMTHDIEKAAPGVSLDLSVQYLSAIPEGSTVIVQAETVRKGRSVAFLAVNLHDKETKKLLARGSHVKFVTAPKL